MAIAIQTNTAGIDPAVGTAVPRISLIPGASGPVAICNLTNNFDADPTKVGWAFNLTGHVDATVGPTDNLATYKFGFVQYIRHSFFGVFYAGRTSREGSISMMLGSTIGSDFMLDCYPRTQRPFIVDPDANSSFQDPEVVTTMGDHPVISIRQQEKNAATGAQNYLFHIVDDREAFSILTMRQPSGQFQALSHVRWTLRYEFKFKWSGGTPTALNSSKFSMGTPLLGAPTGGEIAAALGGLSATQTPIANEKAREAMRVMLSPPAPNRTDQARWFSNVPNDFYS